MSRKRSGDTGEVGRLAAGSNAGASNPSGGGRRGGGVAQGAAAPQAEGPDEEAGRGLEQPAAGPGAGAAVGGCKPDKGGIAH